MKQPRIVVNLVFFAALGVVLAVWALRSLISIDALERPYHVTVQFETSPGLRPDQEVTHLGVHVGTVGDVDLRDGHVDVRLDLERGTEIPAGVGARVLRKSAIGEPYIELTEPAKPGGDLLAGGDLIPGSRTKPTVDYQELFGRLNETLRAVDPRDAGTLVHEAATGLRGRGGSVESILADSHRLTETLAADAGTLDALAVELTRLTATLTDHRKPLASGVDDLAAVTAAIAKNREHLETVLADGPGALAAINGLLAEARPGLGCLLTAVATPSEPLMTPANSARIRHVLEMVPTLKALVTDITAREASGPYLRVTPVITIGGSEAAAEYTTPRARPRASDVPLCSANSNSGSSGSEAEEGGSGGGDPSTSAPADTAPNGSTRPVSTEDGPSSSVRWPHLLPPVLGGLVLLAVLARALRALRARNQR